MGEDITGMMIRRRHRHRVDAGAMLKIVEDRAVTFMNQVGAEYEDR
jgi:hypothetical protein